MRSLALFIDENKRPSERQAKQMMDLCKISKPYGFLTNATDVIGIFSSHNRETGTISIIHSDELKLNENLDDYQLYLIEDTTVIEYDENNLSEVPLTKAQYEQILQYLKGI